MIKDIEDKISNITNLASTSALNAKVKEVKAEIPITTVENKIPLLDVKITAKKLVNDSGLNEKIKTLAGKEEIKKLATKAELKPKQDKKAKRQTYDLTLMRLDFWE